MQTGCIETTKMKKQKSYNFIIRLTVYPFDVMISLGEPDDKLFASLRKHGIDYNDTKLETYSDTQRGRTVLFKGNQSLIRMYELSYTPEWYGNLAHEVFHCVEFILDRIGMRLTLDSDEAYAYLIGYITKEVHRKIT